MLLAAFIFFLNGEYYFGKKAVVNLEATVILVRFFIFS